MVNIDQRADVIVIGERRTTGATRRLGRYRAVEEELKLAALPTSVCGRLTRLLGSGPQRQQLMDKGIVPGTLISVLRVVQAGKLIEYGIRNSKVLLSHEDAARVLVTIEEDTE